MRTGTSLDCGCGKAAPALRNKKTGSLILVKCSAVSGHQLDPVITGGPALGGAQLKSDSKIFFEIKFVYKSGKRL